MALLNELGIDGDARLLVVYGGVVTACVCVDRVYSI